MTNKWLFLILILIISCQQKEEEALFDPIQLREELHQVYDKHELMGFGRVITVWRMPPSNVL